MKDFDEASIVMVGVWNVKIFTPEWIIDNLLELSINEGVEVSIDKRNLNLRFKYKDFHFFPNDRSFEIATDKINEENLLYINKKSLRLLSLLPHTPGLKVGINFKKSIDSQLPKLKLGEFKKEGFSLNEIKLTKNIGEGILNVIYSNEANSKDIVTLNFHFTDIKKFSTKSIVEKFKIADEY